MGMQDLLFERRIASPNGEDFLYVFYNRESGTYVLLSYNVIEQRRSRHRSCAMASRCSTTDTCRTSNAATNLRNTTRYKSGKRRTLGKTFARTRRRIRCLFKIGNQDIVRGMAECHEIIGLTTTRRFVRKSVRRSRKKTGDTIDSYFWINNEEAFRLGEVLAEIRSAATAAVDEFDKVVRVRRNTQQQFDAAAAP